MTLRDFLRHSWVHTSCRQDPLMCFDVCTSLMQGLHSIRRQDLLYQAVKGCASCKGRCGVEYYRGFLCQCDYSCLGYGECCKDFESQCTTKNSCKGRCGEGFKRGRLCTCDPDCFKYNQCCPDYTIHCDAEEEISGASGVTAPGTTNSCNNVNANVPKDVYGQIFPNDDSSNIGPEDPKASQIPESTDNYGSSPASLLDHVTAEPTLSTDTVELSTEAVTDLSQIPVTPSYNEPPQADASGETPTESADTSDATGLSDSGTTLPQSTTTVLQGSTQSASTSAPQTEPATRVSTLPTTVADTAEQETTAQTLEEVSSNEPEVTTSSSSSPTTTAFSATSVSTDVVQDSSTAPENSPQPPVPSSTTVVPPSVTEATTTKTKPDATENNGEDNEVVQDSSTAPENSPQPPVPSSTTVVPPSVTEATTTNPKPDATENNGEDTDVVQDSSTAPENSPQPPVPSSTTVVPPSVTEVTTTNPKPDATENNGEDATTAPPSSSSLPDLQTPLMSVSPPESEPKATTADDVTATETTADPLKANPDPNKPQTPAHTTKPQQKPAPPKPWPTKPVLDKPTSKPETKPLDAAQTLDDTRDFQGDDSNDTNLCSGRPVGGVTTLRNGTIVVFRGHYFWVLDRNRMPGPARGITQVWGVPSPIDTVFTRCNCQGKTYIFRGGRYWRFENDVLDPGYPKLVSTGFDGLRGHITAALSVPQYHRRRESVYFFKRGGLVQKYSYQFGTSPTCGRKKQYAVYTVRNRLARQAVSLLGPSINIRTAWRGFPSTVTAAVSVPNTREPEGYKYYVFSRSKSYHIRVDGERPAVAAPKVNASPQSNDVFKCPRKV
ncbi:proteoglycan 4b [Aulostomus maculatus]